MNKALKIAIVDRGLKQYVIAQRIGVDEARMSGFVNERFEPTADEKRKIARILRKSVTELWPSESEAMAS